MSCFNASQSLSLYPAKGLLNFYILCWCWIFLCAHNFRFLIFDTYVCIRPYMHWVFKSSLIPHAFHTHNEWAHYEGLLLLFDPRKGSCLTFLSILLAFFFILLLEWELTDVCTYYINGTKIQWMDESARGNIYFFLWLRPMAFWKFNFIYSPCRRLFFILYSFRSASIA